MNTVRKFGNGVTSFAWQVVKSIAELICALFVVLGIVLFGVVLPSVLVGLEMAWLESNRVLAGVVCIITLLIYYGTVIAVSKNYSVKTEE